MVKDNVPAFLIVHILTCRRSGVNGTTSSRLFELLEASRVFEFREADLRWNCTHLEAGGLFFGRRRFIRACFSRPPQRSIVGQTLLSHVDPLPLHSLLRGAANSDKVKLSPKRYSTTTATYLSPSSSPAFCSNLPQRTHRGARLRPGDAKRRVSLPAQPSQPLKCGLLFDVRPFGFSLPPVRYLNKRRRFRLIFFVAWTSLSLLKEIELSYKNRSPASLLCLGVQTLGGLGNVRS